MDLVTLVAACSLALDPKLMHALIWQQTGGEPWSFSLPGQRLPQVYRSPSEAIHEAQTALPTHIPVRVGLTGLPADPTTATLAMFTPCLNISIAAQQITQLIDRCKTVPPLRADPIHCAIAGYRGSWDHPDHRFADAVLASVTNCDPPNFDMPDDSYMGSGDFAGAATRTGQRAFTAPPVAPDDQQQGWSSALFPARSQQFGRLSTSTNSNGPGADRLQASSELSAHPTTSGSHDDSCADCLSGGRNDCVEPGSHDFAWCRAFGSEARERRPTDRTMAG